MRRRGRFENDGTAIAPLEKAELTQLLLCGLLCNDAALQKEQGGLGRYLGILPKGPLVVLAGKADLNQSQSHPGLCLRVVEVPFSSERKRMSVVVAMPRMMQTIAAPTGLSQASADHWLFSKGSPELLAGAVPRAFGYKRDRTGAGC
jgi:Ca2+-transporting ATPase